MPDKKPNNGPKKRERLARQYGFVQAFFETDPELKHLFNQAVKKTWTAERFVAELRDTKWFKKNAVTVRNALMQKTADPATYKSRVSQLTSTIKDTWGKTFGGAPHPEELRRWAETAYTMGWSEAQVMDHMTQSINFQKLMTNKRLGGTAADTKTKLEALGRAYGLNLGDRYISSQVEKVIKGDDSIEGVAARVKDWSKREYAAYAAEIDGGATVEDIAEPYVSKMAEVLELNPQTLHARQDMVQRALKNRNQDGQPVAMGMNDFENMLRKDKRWQYTKNAKQQMTEVTEGLLRNFGLLA